METNTARGGHPNGRHALGVVTACIIALASFGKAYAQEHNAMNESTQRKSITLGAGCFWCVEAVFEQIEGVHSAVSGYMGGHIKNPAYREVCTGRTGHAEVVRVLYDDSIVSLEDILRVFFATHDPTTLNRQGADVGTQYRSAIFYSSESEREVAEQILSEAQTNHNSAIVTEITEASAFYEAEDYHQAYYELNGEAPYCRAVIAPKMKKFQDSFAPLLKLH